MRGLYGIVDRSASPDRSWDEIAAAFLDGGARVVQLRMKGEPDAEVLEVAARLLPRCVAAGARLIIDDRVDIARSLPGVGVHLGQDDLDPTAARRILGSGPLIGWSTHTLAQVDAAAALPVDYLGFGPVWSAATKHLSAGDSRSADPAVGVAGLAAAILRSTLPVVAIGGISGDNLAAVAATGVPAFAVITAVTRAADMAAAARSLSEAFRELSRAC